MCDNALAQKRSERPFPFPEFNPTEPDPSNLPAIGRYERAGVRIFTKWLNDMLRLGQPTHGQRAWNDLLSAIRRHTVIITEQQAAAARGDASTFTKDYYDGNRAQDDTVRDADVAGVPICATAAGA